ncbi:uncharacterized protein N0V89_005718 [Didymosphaeria variabile]|uniref:Rhodopsin domain-containing protein n=1 Tax=Didymosphaeria variabile TaxID=1932322 RepID=A0A9W8XLJ0_9PLEO|nr:uncharacterized protein N0V89_005718 [Didymosphaeria variabile]KAJ4353986.1 hypothetical protein N0V89_005718 [Didymosphaeria variabile]
MMYNFGLTLTKVSIVLQYIRIVIDHNVRKACWVLLWIILATCVETLFTGLFSCYPIPKFWDDRIPGGCVNKPALASIASILRLNALHKVAITTDITWDNPGTATWSAIELNVGIICASLPTLRAFIIQHFPRVFRSTRGSTPTARVGYKTNNGSVEIAEGDESELVRMPAGRPSVATNVSDPFGDVEKGKGTFFASDSEQELANNDFERT